MHWKTKIIMVTSFFGLITGSLWAATPTEKERYTEAMAHQATAPELTVAGLQALADEGYARAMDRLAYMTFKGIGTAQETDVAIALYLQAFAAGRTSSLVSLGKVYLTIGEHQSARDTLREASDAGHIKAEAVLAWAHSTGRLGPLSKPETGFDALVTLASADARDAQMYLLDAATKINRTPPNLVAVLDRLHALQDAGDSKAAEALARFYRMNDHPRGTLATRAELLNTTGIRNKVRVEEGLYLARDRQPKQFWTASEQLVESAAPDVYARGLFVAARINKNAYVRIVQKELAALGYAVGPASPYMNRPLIRSLNQFCRDHDIYESCRRGPLKSSAIKAVAVKLAEVRQPI
ncbi:MAG: hypothetical protein AAFR45_07870 [Pseudomonadota bacterium]